MVVVVGCVLGVYGLPLSTAKCELGAIFNFGDSNSDTGGFWAAFPAQSSPFGMTYFKRPAGRASDGRAVIDFLGNVYIPTYPSQNIDMFLLFKFKKNNSTEPNLYLLMKLKKVNCTYL